MRIVSLLPSATEIVCALGARTELVGRSSECDHPEDVRSVPVIMRPRTGDELRTSREIDASVATRRSAGESLYRLDVDALRSARPDLILTQDLCGVCSVTGDEVAAACREAGIAPRVLSLTPTRLGEVADSVLAVGHAIGRPSESAVLASELRPAAASNPLDPPSVAVVEWLDPPILAGLWVADMVVAAGGSSIGPPAGSPGRRTAWAELATQRVDWLILAPCSYPVERTARAIDDERLGPSIAAVHPRRGTLLVDEAHFSRPGPRLAQGRDLLNALVTGADPTGLPGVVPWRPSLLASGMG